MFVRKAGGCQAGNTWTEPQISLQEKAALRRRGWFFPWMGRLAEVTGKAEGPLPNITLLVFSSPSVTSGICLAHLWPLSGNGEFLQRSRTCPRVPRAAMGSSGASRAQGHRPSSTIASKPSGWLPRRRNELLEVPPRGMWHLPRAVTLMSLSPSRPGGVLPWESIQFSN